MLAGSVAGLCLLLCACSLEDDRDICCGNIRMEIRYVPYGVEELATYIRSLRHFVFDAGGRFVREIPSGEPIRMLRFSLPDGDYTLLTLGNAESPLAFEAGDSRRSKWNWRASRPRANTSMPTNCIGACAACMWTDRDSRRLRPT